MNFFYNLIEDIAYIFDIKEICRIIIEKIVKVMNITKAQILLLNEQRQLYPIAAHGFEQHKKNDTLERWVLEKGSPILLNDIENLPHELADKLNAAYFEKNSSTLPLVAVPIKTSSKSLGVLKVCQKKHQKMFSSDDLKLLTSIGSQVGMALNNVYMITELRETEKIKKEMELASQIQKELLPKSVPAVPKLDIAGRCVSANAVGGDYYDFFLNDDMVNIVLADVSGHGVSAALFMSTVRSTLRGLFSDNIPISEVAYRMNNFICSDSGTSGMFVTIFYLRYFLSTEEITYINSGHNFPILIKGVDRSIHLLDSGGSPAGFLEEVKFDVSSQSFKPGDLFVAYTDGFIEAKDKNDNFFGEERLIEVIKTNYHLSSQQIINKIFSEVYQFSEGRSQRDDMTIVVIKKQES